MVLASFGKAASARAREAVEASRLLERGTGEKVEKP